MIKVAQSSYNSKEKQINNSMPSKNDTRYKPVLGFTLERTPVCTTLPVDIYPIVKAMENPSDFVRRAVMEKLERDGIIN